MLYRIRYEKRELSEIYGKKISVSKIENIDNTVERRFMANTQHQHQSVEMDSF